MRRRRGPPYSGASAGIVASWPFEAFPVRLTVGCAIAWGERCCRSTTSSTVSPEEQGVCYAPARVSTTAARPFRWQNLVGHSPTHRPEYTVLMRPTPGASVARRTRNEGEITSRPRTVQRCELSGPSGSRRQLPGTIGIVRPPPKSSPASKANPVTAPVPALAGIGTKTGSGLRRRPRPGLARLRQPGFVSHRRPEKESR